MLVCGIIARNETVLADAERLLASVFGPVAERSSVIPFDFTDYYEPETGPNLLRRWVGFSRLVRPDSLAQTKLTTVDLERRLATSGNPESAIQDPESASPSSLIPSPQSSVARPANLDPGLLTLHNLVLASTKDYAHRVYLGSGIHAELTFIYKSGRFEPLPWTYPDYRTGTCLEFLARCRGLLRS